MPKVTLDVSDVLHHRLTEEAAIIGCSVEEYTIQALLRGLKDHADHRVRRAALLEQIRQHGPIGVPFDPVKLIREDRNR